MESWGTSSEPWRAAAIPNICRDASTKCGLRMGAVKARKIMTAERYGLWCMRSILKAGAAQLHCPCVNVKKYLAQGLLFYLNSKRASPWETVPVQLVDATPSDINLCL